MCFAFQKSLVNQPGIELSVVGQHLSALADLLRTVFLVKNIFLVLWSTIEVAGSSKGVI